MDMAEVEAMYDRCEALHGPPAFDADSGPVPTPVRTFDLLDATAGPVSLDDGTTVHTKPRLEVFAPLPDGDDVRWPVAVVIPGGGFNGLNPYEGPALCAELRAHGVLGMQCRYTCKAPSAEAVLRDARAVVPTAQAAALELGCADPSRVAVIGCSAGAVLALQAAVDGRGASAPKAVGLVYPLVSTAKDERLRRMFGEGEAFKPEARVPRPPPPLWLFSGARDPCVSAAAVADLGDAWAQAGGAVEATCLANARPGDAWPHGYFPVRCASSLAAFVARHLA